MTRSIKRSYHELISIKSFEDRFNYLKLTSEVGIETFGYDRYLNQMFYKSLEWENVRRQVILRDSNLDYCLDLAHPDFPIIGRIVIHHMNPIQIQDMDDYEKILDPEYLVCCSLDTHNALHYGSELYLDSKKIIERAPNDTCPWKGGSIGRSK